jgi:hypothetical protein
MGGSREAEMATPTSALMPPPVTPRPTTKPLAYAACSQIGVCLVENKGFIYIYYR